MMAQKKYSKKRKTLDLYTFIYNDEDILPFFLDYYKFVDRMTFIDSDSTDRTMDILCDFSKTWGKTIHLIQTGFNSWDMEGLHEYRNHIWQGSDMDLVLFPDADEIFYHPDLIKFLHSWDYDIYEMQGFEMISDKMPKKSLLEIKTGVPFQMYNKSTFFNPKINIKFPNAHLRYTPNTNVCIGEIKLLHYRTLGIELLKKRRDRERDRLPVNQRIRAIYTDEQLKSHLESYLDKAIKVI